jgi:hypothetical protein
MAIFVVLKEEVHTVEIEVNAKDEDCARDKVHRGLGKAIAGCEFNRINSRTIDDWEVYPVTVKGRKKGK